ncbi:MAG: hypothetical protein ACI4XB_03835 [Ruminococcus sp.]
MKRNQYAVLGLVLAGSMAVSVGCSKPGGEDASAAQKLGGSFTTEMTLDMEELQATGTLSRMGDGVWSVSFAEPSTLAGVVLDFCDGEVTASYKGLTFSVPQTAMPAKSVLSNLIQVVDSLAQQEEITGEASDGYVLVEGDLEGNPYILKLTKSGELAGFEMDNLDVALEFEQFQSGAPIATATTTVTEAETGTETAVESEEME